MRTRWVIAAALALWAPGLLFTAEAENAPAHTPAIPAPANTTPVVAEQADQLLKQMAAYIGSAEHFTFHADITFDHVLPSGQKLQFSSSEDVALQRPGLLYVEWTGDLGDRQFWYDGRSVTLFDPSTPFYASEDAPPDIGAMLKKAVAQLGFTPPLADFFYSDPYPGLRRDVQFGVYLGMSEVNGRNCHSLAFVNKDIDWQIWIDPGPQLVPCKLVITYKTHPEQPQFSAVFTDWDFAPRIAESIFTPDLPVGVEPIPFAPVVASADPK